MDVEEDIEELRELIEKNIEVTEDTNRLVRNMRRTARWAFVFQILWWLFIAGVTGAAYYYYVQPYVTSIERMYGISQQQTQGFNDQVVNFVKYFSMPHATSTDQ